MRLLYVYVLTNLYVLATIASPVLNIMSIVLLQYKYLATIRQIDKNHEMRNLNEVDKILS